MDETTERGAAVRIPPPFVYLVGIGVGVLLEFYTELLRLDVALVWRITGGGVAAAVGVGLMIGAISKFKATKQAVWGLYWTAYRTRLPTIRPATRGSGPLPTRPRIENSPR